MGKIIKYDFAQGDTERELYLLKRKIDIITGLVLVNPTTLSEEDMAEYKEDVKKYETMKNLLGR